MSRKRNKTRKREGAMLGRKNEKTWAVLRKLQTIQGKKLRTNENSKSLIADFRKRTFMSRKRNKTKRGRKKVRCWVERMRRRGQYRENDRRIRKKLWNNENSKRLVGAFRKSLQEQEKKSSKNKKGRKCDVKNEKTWRVGQDSPENEKDDDGNSCRSCCSSQQPS